VNIYNGKEVRGDVKGGRFEREREEYWVRGGREDERAIQRTLVNDDDNGNAELVIETGTPQTKCPDNYSGCSLSSGADSRVFFRRCTDFHCSYQANL
jgi:hypothetical protein